MTISDIVFGWCVYNRLFYDRERFDEFVSDPLSKCKVSDAALAVKCHGNVTTMSLEDIEAKLKEVINEDSNPDR